MRQFPTRSRAVVGVTLAIVLVVLMLSISEITFRYRWANDALDEIAPRYARLAGIKAASDDIRAAVTNVDTALAAVAYPLTMDHGKVGSDLQQRIRRIAEQNGVTVANSQVLALRPQKDFAEVPVSVTLEGEPAGVRSFLGGLRHQQPSIQVDELAFQAFRGGRARSESGSQKMVVNLIASSVTLAEVAK